MSSNRKKSISYTISASSDDDDDDDDYGRKQSHNRKHKSGSSSRHQMHPMQQMNSMMNSMLMNPFGMFGSGLNGPRRDMMPFGFPSINDIFENFQVNPNNPNCHSYSSSTFMTMSSGPDGRPQVYQASQSTRTAPGGIRETKKAVCDSRTGTKKLAIGHHIGERGHIMEREQNLHSGQEEEHQEFINLDEEEADEFNREWETKTQANMNAIGYGQPRSRSRRQRQDVPAILGSDRYRTRPRISARRHYPAITSTSSLEHSSEKKKKRNQRHEEDSDEEDAGKKSLKFLKSSHKKKKSLN